jgi:peroxiredoxin
MKNRTGTTAATFELNDESDHVRRLEDYRGRWLLMVFHRHLG